MTDTPDMKKLTAPVRRFLRSHLLFQIHENLIENGDARASNLELLHKLHSAVAFAQVGFQADQTGAKRHPGCGADSACRC